MTLAKADNPKKTKVFQTAVLDGPYILLVRNAIQFFWPKIYNDLAAAAGSSRASKLPPHIRQLFDGMSVSVANDTTQPQHTPSIAPHTATNVGVRVTPLLSDDVTQEEGEQHCIQICRQYPSLIDGKLGTFKEVTAKIHLKVGHEKFLRVLPPPKVPYGLQDVFKPKLDEMMETYIPVNGIKLRCASQLVPVLRKGDKSKLRLCVNYKSTLNDHIEDEPYVFQLQRAT